MKQQQHQMSRRKNTTVLYHVNDAVLNWQKINNSHSCRQWFQARKELSVSKDMMAATGNPIGNQ